MLETTLRSIENRPGDWQFRTVFHSLFVKFLLVLVVIFLLLVVPGFYFLIQYETRDYEEALASRVGNQTARVAAMFERHDVVGNPLLVRDLLGSLAADRAFLCAELKTVDGGRVVAAFPPNVGCLGQNGEHRLALSVGAESANRLFVQFTSAEIAESRKLRQTLSILVVVFGIFGAAIAASFGFHFIVNRPLKNLLNAIVRNAETGERMAIAVSKQDEIGAVTEAYNTMLERDVEREKVLIETNNALHASREEFRTLSTELEDRVRDRTRELKNREAALYRSEQRFRDYSKASSDWYWEMDENLRFSHFSDRFTKITGVDTAVLLGKTREETGVPGVDPEQWENHLNALHSCKPFRNFIHPRTMPDGRIVWLSINGIPHFDQDGVFKGFRGTGNEITEIVEARRTAEMARLEAEAANSAKSEFLASMSHELRTPLNAIIGFSEIIKDERFGLVGSYKYHEYAKDIHKSGQHLLSLINDVLDLSKIESGADELNETEVEVPAVLQSVHMMVQQRAGQSGVAIDLDVEYGLPPLFADQRKLKQVLLNLLTNAVKFTDTGGAVTLRVFCEADGRLCFQIADTGIGMDPQDIPKALRQFAQVDASYNRKYEGTGLGLPLSKILVEQHDGTLEVQSELGKGTTVTVHFPAIRVLRDDVGPAYRVAMS